MTKLEFMKELESLLPDIPLEERDEALQYYNGYFDDAGEDHEQEIITELGSPARVASIIKADLNPNATDRESKGYFTEKGYQETIKNEYEIVDVQKTTTENNGQTNINQTGNSYNSNSAYESYIHGKYSNAGQSTNNTAGQSTNNTAGQGTKSSNTGLIVILALVSFPIWLPLLLSAMGIAIGVIAAILGIIFGFGVAGITMIGVGIALFIAGLVQISVPFFGLLMIGAGLIILGTGMLLTLACIVLCKNVLPAMVRGIVNLCRLPFKNRSVMA